MPASILRQAQDERYPFGPSLSKSNILTKLGCTLSIFSNPVVGAACWQPHVWLREDWRGGGGGQYGVL